VTGRKRRLCAGPRARGRPIAAPRARVTVAGVRRQVARLGLSLVGLWPAVAAASAPCPAWQERPTFDCMRGYLRVDPVSLVLASHRPGAAIGGSLGAFRAFGGFALSFGARAGYAMTNRGAHGFDRALHVGPELRVGAVNHRAFGYMLVRGGYSRRFEVPPARQVLGGASDAYHYGLGVGIWGRVSERLLVGAEGALDLVQFKREGVADALVLSLTIGTWL
jgi:hypothetical protein